MPLPTHQETMQSSAIPTFNVFPVYLNNWDSYGPEIYYMGSRLAVVSDMLSYTEVTISNEKLANFLLWQKLYKLLPSSGYEIVGQVIN